MPGKNVARTDLVDTLSEDLFLPRAACSDVLECLLDEMAACLSNGGEVKIVNFGTFSARLKAARVGRNFHTDQAMVIEPRRDVVFRASRKLRHYSNHPEDIPRRPKRQLELF